MPVNLDLANLPMGWGVTVWSGCDPTQANCRPDDSYTSGFTGTLQVSGAPGAFQTALCLSVTEGMANPHPFLHSLHLETPPVAAH